MLYWRNKRALTLRIKEHQANCRNQNQHSAVVDHSWDLYRSFMGFTRAKVINTQCNTYKRKIAESLLIVTGNKNSFPLSIFKT